jgi:hypothetical protein
LRHATDHPISDTLNSSPLYLFLEQTQVFLSHAKTEGTAFNGQCRMKHKTWAVWLTLFLGPLGLHRLYLFRKFDAFSWSVLLPSLLGVYGLFRANTVGLDDHLSWLLIPLLGLSVSACALTAIVYGLMDAARWNARYNPGLAAQAKVGETNWLTVGGLVLSLFLGASVLMACIAYSFENFFRYLGTQ